MKRSKAEQKQEAQWQTTPVANLVRNTASGNYYARVRLKGKLIWKSLKTDALAVAKLRLGDFLKEEGHRAEVVESAARGKMTFADAVVLYKRQVENAPHLKPRAKEYRISTIDALLKSWSALETTDLRKITASDCSQWAAGFAKTYCPSFFNNTVGTLRQILKIAVESGARYGNPASELKKVKIRQKILKLPEHDQFPALVQAVRTAGGRFSHDCGDLIEFLAYSGARKSEAARVIGSDCDFSNGRISIKGDPDTGTKNWEVRHIPMIADMRRLLERTRSEKSENDWLTKPVVGVRECQKAIDSACKKLGIARFTHHDLRHLFATRCIESGVDIPTVSRWLGHKDGGALAMKTYGHLRDQHSTTMAQKVVFTETAQNVVPLPVADAAVRSGHANASNEDEKKSVGQAKAKYGYAWWASQNPIEVFWGQLNEKTWLVPTERFLKAAEEAMGREVFPHEAEDRQTLIEEFVALIPEATMTSLRVKISAARNICATPPSLARTA
ncbi:MAG TPA: site-specific integrase [Verrucomicrobiae bacterium]|jgi:integrase